MTSQNQSSDPSAKDGGSKSQTADDSQTTGVSEDFDETTQPADGQTGYTAPGGTARDRSLGGTSPRPAGFNRASDEGAQQDAQRQGGREQQAQQ